jgi:hypothetical protein
MNMTVGGTDNPGVRPLSDDVGETWHISVEVTAFNEPSKWSTM